ncbi:MAG TPA: RNA polymerase sigma factor [Chitinophagales bacterium]|nr:RNA polymerase sigma factor [Chitinophagales bacterium]HRK26052.1 RNA polymerase sigma factor [Chitinophagales bacterium]
MTEQELIQQCKTGNRNAQRLLYDKFAPVMYGVCRRYIHNQTDAEDVLISGFYRVFAHLPGFEGKGSLEGWIRKIMVNEALMFIRRQKAQKNLTWQELDDSFQPASFQKTDSNLHHTDLLQLLHHLPPGYRTVFNLYAIEGYSHEEIAQTMQISVNTSKSQLLKARRMLQKLIEEPV